MQTISGTKCLIDSNIIVYSLDRESPFHSTAREIMQECFEDKRQGVVAHQNIVESINVLVIKSPDTQQDFVADTKTLITEAGLEIIFPLINTLSTFIKLCESLPGRRNEFFDIYLAATMLDNDIHHIITANTKDFKDIPGITVYNPFKEVQKIE